MKLFKCKDENLGATLYISAGEKGMLSIIASLKDIEEVVDGSKENIDSYLKSVDKDCIMCGKKSSKIEVKNYVGGYVCSKKCEKKFNINSKKEEWKKDKESEAEIVDE